MDLTGRNVFRVCNLNCLKSYIRWKLKIITIEQWRSSNAFGITTECFHYRILHFLVGNDTQEIYFRSVIFNTHVSHKYLFHGHQSSVSVVDYQHLLLVFLMANFSLKWRCILTWLNKIKSACVPRILSTLVQNVYTAFKKCGAVSPKD